MTTGGGHLECALGGFLALDVGKVEERAFGFEDFGLRPRQHLRALEVIGELDQRGCRDNLDIRARPSGFRSANRRADQTLAAGIGADGGGQHAGNRGNRTVEAEFAQDRKTGQGIVRNGADGRRQAERDRQVVVAAFLGQIGGREVDGDAAPAKRALRRSSPNAPVRVLRRRPYPASRRW